MAELGWKQWNRRQNARALSTRRGGDSSGLLAPEELRTLSHFREQLRRAETRLFSDREAGGTCWVAGANATQDYLIAFIDEYASSSFPVFAPASAELPAEAEPSPTEVLASLQARELPAPQRRRLILAAEVLQFDPSQARALKPLLRQHIDRCYSSEQSEEVVAVASAVRKYIALLSVDELPAVRELLRRERKAPPAFEMEVAKMVARKLTATLPEDTTPLRPLGDELLDLVDGYATPRMLPKRHCGAVALDAMLSLALLRSPHLANVTARLSSLAVTWFRATVARQANIVRTELNRRFSPERCGRALECLAVLAASAESPLP